MGSLLGGARAPRPVVAAPPSVDDKGIQDAATAERMRRQKASGRASNITSSLATAVSDSQATVARSSLLGG